MKAEKYTATREPGREAEQVSACTRRLAANKTINTGRKIKVPFFGPASQGHSDGDRDRR